MVFLESRGAGSCRSPGPSCSLLSPMKPAAAVQEPIRLAGEILQLRAWRIPDLVAYQHSYDEWWLAPLDDNYPLVRVNRTGIEMLGAMNGHVTVGALVEKYGDKICG